MSAHKIRTQQPFDNLVHVCRTLSIYIGWNHLPRSRLVPGLQISNSGWRSAFFQKCIKKRLIEICTNLFQNLRKYLPTFLHMPFSFSLVFDCKFSATSGTDLGGRSPAQGSLLRTHFQIRPHSLAIHFVILGLSVIVILDIP